MKFLKNLSTIFCLALLSIQSFSRDKIWLWPNDEMPNSNGKKLEWVEERQRITQVDIPFMYSFPAPKKANSGSAVLICPPGGYAKLAYSIAGIQFAKWLNTLGINAFVLIHRLPTSPDLVQREKGPIQDAQRAMKIIRANAEDWKIDTTKIGVMGASAGGHVASSLGTHLKDYTVIGDSIDSHSYNPNFMILVSPVITMGENAHKGSRKNFLGENPSEENITDFSNELRVSASTPPTFIVVAQNDPVVPPMNSLLFYEALIEKNVTGSLHIFPDGKHSIALRNDARSVNKWVELCEDWLNDIGIL